MARDYRVISRRPPFKGLTVAQNLTGKDKAFATEICNVVLQSEVGVENVVISSRSEWKKLFDTSLELFSAAEYTSPYTGGQRANHSPSRLSRVAGAHLVGKQGIYVWAPERHAFLNPDQHRLQISALSDGGATVRIDGAVVATIYGYLNQLVSAIAPYNITPITYPEIGYNSAPDRATTPYLSNVETAQAVQISSVADFDETLPILLISARVLLPQYIPRSGANGSEPPGFDKVFPVVYKHVLSPSRTIFGTLTNIENTRAFLADGEFASSTDNYAIIPFNGLTSAVGASFYGYAVQPVYIPINSKTLQQGDVDTDRSVGLLSAREVASYAVLPVQIEGIIGYGIAARLNVQAKNAGSVEFNSYEVDLFQTYFGSPGPAPTPLCGGAKTGTLRWPTGPAGAAKMVLAGGGFSNRVRMDFPVNGSHPIWKACPLNMKLIVWRTKAQTSEAAADSALLYKVMETSVEDVSTITGRSFITDNVLDAALTEPYLPSSPDPNNSGTRAISTVCEAYHQTRRVYGGSNGAVIWTLPGEIAISAPGVSNIMMLYPVQALASFNDILYIFCTDGIYALSGTMGTLDSTLQKISALKLQKQVISAQSSVCVGGSEVLFIASDTNAYAISGSTVAPINEFSLYRPGGLTSAPVQYPPTNGAVVAVTPRISAIRTVYSSNTGEYIIGVSGSNILDIIDREGRWYKHTLPENTYLIDLTTLSGALAILVSSVSGSALYTLSDERTLSAPVSAPWKYASSWEDMEDPRTEKNFVRLQVDLAQGVSQNGVLTVTVEYDWLAGKPGMRREFPLRVAQGFGNQPWGAVPWGDKNQVNVVLPLGTEKHRSMRVILEGTQNLAISGWSIEVADAGAHAKTGTPSASFNS